MNGRVLSSVIVVGVGVGLVVACGSGGSGTSPGAVTSVDSSKKIADLSDSEAQQLCRDAQAFTQSNVGEADQKKISCGISASFVASFNAKTDAEAQANCKKAYDDCLAKPSTSTQAGDGGAPKDTCADAKKQTTGCDATVGEYSQCASDSVNAYKGLASKDYCAEAKAPQPDAGASRPSTTVEQPSSCTALRQKCPQLFGSSSSSSASAGTTSSSGG